MVADFRLFGDVEVLSDGCAVEIGHVRQRSVLVALLMDPGRSVSVDVLTDRVWADRPPQRMRAAVHSYVSRLRRVLAVAGVGIVRQSSGYRVLADPMSVDVHRFRRLIGQARVASDDREAAALFDQALALWGGDILASLDTPWLNSLRVGLAGERLAAELDRNDVRLRLGEHVRLVRDLPAAADAHPLNERLAGQLILALYRCGRTGDALTQYERLRSRLAGELGADPNRHLRDLHRSILTESPALDEPVHEAWRHPARRAVPRQLPAVPPLLAGRAAELARLDALRPAAGEEPPAARVSVLSGTAGIGKTALAVYWAHRVSPRFPDGQLYADLHGFDSDGPATPVAEVIVGFLHALEVPAVRIPGTLNGQIALYRSILADRTMLVILDNAQDANQARPLLPGSGRCTAVVTSRDQLIGLVTTEGADVVNLDLFSEAESRELLCGRIGAGRVAAEPSAVAEIIAGSARLPLALSIVAARAATHPGFRLAALAAELREERDRLDALLAGGSTADVRAVFSSSYRGLTADAAATFRLLGLHPGPDISRAAAAALTGRPARATRSPLVELTRANLLRENDPGRFAFHDLLRLYAQELTEAQDSADQRHDTTRRLLDHYLHSAHAAACLLSPHRVSITLTARLPGVVPERFGRREDAIDWFTVERPVLLRLVRMASDGGFPTHAWQLAWTLTHFLDRRAHWDELLTVNRLALRDSDEPVHAHEGIARALINLGRYEEAEQHVEQVAVWSRQAGDARGQADAHTGLQLLRSCQQRYEEARDHGERALELFRSCGSPSQIAMALSNVGQMHTELGNPEQAIAYGRQALALLDDLDDPPKLGGAWDMVATAHDRLGHLTEAIDGYRNSVTMFRVIGARYKLALVLNRLGEACRLAGNAADARQAWTEALSILAAMNHPVADDLRERLDGLDGVHPVRNQPPPAT